MKIVTAGSRYIDIDAYAGCIAYANLLNLKGIQAKAVSTAKISEAFFNAFFIFILPPEKFIIHYILLKP